jgi:alpha-tubulin suppressor-like RCC1 family protein
MLTKSLTALAIGLLVTNCAPMPGGETASAIVRPAVTAGVAHTCAVLSDGTATCWGLGFGTPKAWNSRAPLPVKGVSKAAAVTAGRNHSCALLIDGTVVCGGSNIFGMLGNQSFSGTASYVPVEVVGL